MENAVGTSIGGAHRLAFPHPDYRPAVYLSQPGRTAIAFNISLHLFLPERGIRACEGGPTSVFGAAVPETAVNEDGESPARHHYVGGTAPGELAVEAEAGALRVKGL